MKGPWERWEPGLWQGQLPAPLTFLCSKSQ